MPLDPRSFMEPRKIDPDALRAMPEPELASLIVTSLESWCTDGEAGAFVDGELLDYAGLLVGRAGNVEGDRIACGWLQRGSSPLRAQIAGWWLGGFWGSSERITEECVRTVAGLARSLEPGTPAFAGIVWALLFAYKNPHSGAGIRSAAEIELRRAAGVFRSGASDRGHLLEALRAVGLDAPDPEKTGVPDRE